MKLVLNAAYLKKALLIIVKLVQNKVYGNVSCSMQGKSADVFDQVIKQCNVTASPTQKNRLKELRSLKKYRPCVDKRGGKATYRRTLKQILRYTMGSKAPSPPSV